MKGFLCHAKEFVSCPLDQCFSSSVPGRGPGVLWRCLRGTCLHQVVGGSRYELLLFYLMGCLFGNIVLLSKECQKSTPFGHGEGLHSFRQENKMIVLFYVVQCGTWIRWGDTEDSEFTSFSRKKMPWCLERKKLHLDICQRFLLPQTSR